MCKPLPTATKQSLTLCKKAYDANQPYDVVFLDWNMPTISGLEVLSYFRAKPEYAQTAFVMLTTQESEQAEYQRKPSRRGAHVLYQSNPVSSLQI